jgi:hypothetical protein
MITINDKELVITEGLSDNTADLLWDILYVLGPRYVFIAPEIEDETLKYNHEYKVVASKKNKFGIFSVKSREEFDSLLKLMSDLCVTDFFITVNASFNNVFNLLSKESMFDNGELLIDEYMLEYPQTICIGEDSLRIDLETFKAAKFQLSRVAKRYGKEV